MGPDLERILEAEIEGMGFELVDFEQVGHGRRPVLRVRIDRPDSRPGHGVTVEDCARVSRALEAILDARDDLPESYVLEVSSPGIPRPIKKRRDFERYRGREIAVHGFGSLAGRGRRLEGILLGIEGEGENEVLRLRLADGTTVELRRAEIARANLVERWEI
jgi:ribosome maturation factor RimP